MKFFSKGGKKKPITQKQIRDISDDDVQVNVIVVEDTEALEEFADEIKTDHKKKHSKKTSDKKDKKDNEVYDWPKVASLLLLEAEKPEKKPKS